MVQLDELIKGKEIVYEDEQDVVRFSMVGGKIQKTITYKKDWFDNNGQPVKSGEVVQITGEEAMAALIRDREYLSYFKVEENDREMQGNDNDKEFLTMIQPLLEGKEIVYEDEQDVVSFSTVGGQIQKTITYKKDWFDNEGQPVKAGNVVQITGEEAINALIKDREYLSYFKVIDADKEISDDAGIEENDSVEIMPVDEQKFSQIYGKAKGKIKDIYAKIKSFFNKKVNNKNDKTNDDNIK